MQPLNPFLAAFSKSSLASQCSPARFHVLLVPSTEVLLNSRDTETGAPLVESIATDEFLGSHVLRIPGPKGSVAGGKDSKDVTQNLREMRGKAKVYSTINGRSVVIKDNLVYSNKGRLSSDQFTFSAANKFSRVPEPCPREPASRYDMVSRYAGS
jgi:hypothetical protein